MMLHLLAASVLTVPVVLPDRDGDGLITITVPRGPFKLGDVLQLCKAEPAFTYALKGQCPVLAKVDPWAINPPVITSQPVPGAGSTKVGPKTNVDQALALDAYVSWNSPGPMTISDVRIGKARRFFQNTWLSDREVVTVNDLLIERVEATVWRGVELAKDNARVVIRDARFTGRDIKDYGAAIQLSGTAHDILVERVHAEGFYAKGPAGYPNADPFVTEKDVYNVTFRYVSGDGSTDGIFDLKGRNILLDHTKAKNAGRYSYRFWGQGRGTEIISINPGAAHIQIAQLSSNWIIEKLIAVGPKPLVSFDSKAFGGTVTIKSCDLTGWGGTVKIKGKGTVIWGEGC